MATKKPTKRQSMLARLDHINATLELRRKKCLAEFLDKSLMRAPQSPQRLAAAMSRHYPRLSVMVIHQNGDVVLQAAPGPARSFEYADPTDWVMNQAEDALKEAAYPSLSDVQSYATGFSDAAPDYENMKELRAENARLKDRRQNDVRPMLMMPGGFGMGGGW